jgi:hypothetical protein
LKTKFKILFSVSLLAVVLYTTVPKVYFYTFFGYTDTSINTVSNTIFVEEKEVTEDCNFEKFDTPVYYSVFKFILNFLPLKDAKHTSFYYQKTSPNFQHTPSLLKNLPIA